MDFTATDGPSSTLVVADLNSVNAPDGAVMDVNNGDPSTDVDSNVTTLASTGLVVFSGATSPEQEPAPFYPEGAPMNAFQTTLTEG